MFASAFYFYHDEANKLQVEYAWTNEILFNTVFSAYSDDIGAAMQRWREVHGNAFEGGEILPCYVNTGTIAAWMDSEVICSWTPLTGVDPITGMMRTGEDLDIQHGAVPQKLYWYGFSGTTEVATYGMQEKAFLIGKREALLAI